MFEHADTDDLIEDRLTLHVPIITQLDGDEVFQTLVACALARIRVLLLAKSDSVCGDAIVPRCPAEESTPPTAKVKQSLPRFHPKLAANVIELVALRLI